MGQELFCINSLKICSNFTFFCLAAGIFQMFNNRCFHMCSKERKPALLCVRFVVSDGNFLDSVKLAMLRVKNSKSQFKACTRRCRRNKVMHVSVCFSF